MDRKLSSKLLQLEEQLSRLTSLQYGNDLCKKVIPWREEFKTFREVINDKKNKEELKYFNKDEKLDWLEDVKKLVDDVKKILDEIVFIVKTTSQKRSIFAFCRNPIADTAFTDTHRIAYTRKRIDRLKTKMYAIGLQVSNRSVPCSGPELCKPAGLPNSEAIYGRDVTDESDLVNFSIMPTIGMAGICKPSLARLEYNDGAVEDFKPEESDVSRISKAILEPVTSKSCDLKDVNDLAASILAGLLCTLSGLMNDKANLTGDPECFKGEIIGGGNTKFNWSKDICVF